MLPDKQFDIITQQCYHAAMKTCNKCNVSKPLAEFSKDKHKRDGLDTICKACRKAYYEDWRRTKHGREIVNRTAARYRRTPKGKATKRRYQQSPKGQEAYRRQYERAKEKGMAQARRTVALAVENGLLKPATLCNCALNDGDCDGPMEYHHPSYRRPLTVIPLCRKHHVLIHDLPYHEVQVD
jgi:hypothetical protein